MTESQMPLSDGQLARLTAAFHRGAADASAALEKWLGLPSVLTFDKVEQVPLQQATTVLGGDEEPVCFCSMDLQGVVTGQLIFVFDEDSGLALAQLVLGRRERSATNGWSDVEISAATETANVIGCAYLNSLQSHLPGVDADAELLPSPPRFQRDYP